MRILGVELDKQTHLARCLCRHEHESRWMRRLLLFPGLIMATPAFADPVELPFLPDGTVDLSALSYRLSGPIYADGSSKLTHGTMLGQTIGLAYDYPGTDLPFDLTLSTGDLSDKAASFLTLLALEAICIGYDEAAGPVMWDEAEAQADGWRVPVSCRDRSALPQS